MGCERPFKRRDLVVCDARPRGPSEHRYWLARKWNLERPTILFVLTNPSCATEAIDDATVYRCYDIAGANGAGGFELVNLVAIRDPDSDATRKRYLGRSDPENDAVLSATIGRADSIVVGWGSFPWVQNRAREVYRSFLGDRRRLLPSGSIKCLGKNADGTPKHPARNSELSLREWLCPRDWF